MLVTRCGQMDMLKNADNEWFSSLSQLSVRPNLFSRIEFSYLPPATTPYRRRSQVSSDQEASGEAQICGKEGLREWPQIVIT